MKSFPSEIYAAFCSIPHRNPGRYRSGRRRRSAALPLLLRFADSFGFIQIGFVDQERFNYFVMQWGLFPDVIDVTTAKTQTGIGTKRNLPFPHQRNPGAKPLIGEPSPTTSVAPRQTVMPPRVTTNGGTFSLVVAKPCTHPQITPSLLQPEARLTRQTLRKPADLLELRAIHRFLRELL